MRCMGRPRGKQPGSAAGKAAVELRVAGASFADIACTLGLSDARHAVLLVERELASHLSTASVEVQRQEASERIDALLRSVWGKATETEHPEHLSALNMALRLVDRHIRLHGLDRPAELVLHTPTAQELETWVAAVVHRHDPEIVEADVIGELGDGRN